MQIPFIAKNQIALFLYSEDIFEMDEMVQKASDVENVVAVENFMPKKLVFRRTGLGMELRKIASLKDFTC